MADRSLTDLTVTELLERLASGEPTPGGGAAAALAGALGAALVSMVCNLTIGRERYAAFEGDASAIRDEATSILATLRAGVQRDADAYDRLMAAFKLPRDTEDEKAARTAEVQSGDAPCSDRPIGDRGGQRAGYRPGRASRGQDQFQRRQRSRRGRAPGPRRH